MWINSFMKVGIGFHRCLDLIDVASSLSLLLCLALGHRLTSVLLIHYYIDLTCFIIFTWRITENRSNTTPQKKHCKTALTEQSFQPQSPPL